MRIGIDARFYGPIGKGLGRYTQKLIEGLEEIDKENMYSIFLRKSNWNEYKPARSNFKKVLADYEWYTLEEQIMMPLAIVREKVDLMHFPHFNVPVLWRGRFVVTIHDLILLGFPTRRATTLGPWKYKIKEAGYRIVISQAIKGSQKIITVSNYTKEELIKYFKVTPSKIIVTYEGHDILSSRDKNSNFQRLGSIISDKKQNEAKNKVLFKKYGIIKPYLLYVGNAYPHKNLEGLLYAFKEFKEKKKSDSQLVLVGKEDYFFERLKKEAENMGLIKEGDVIFTGFITDEELDCLYKGALLYIFPSFYEGFGLPPLEAMTRGIPVVSSYATCLKEVLGEAAYYFNPYKKEDMIKAIEKVIENRQLREKLVRKGLEQVKKFSWKKMARETIEIYKEVVE